MNDDIVRLRAEVAQLTAESEEWDDHASRNGTIRRFERLRAAGDALVAVMQSGSDTGWDAAIDAWQEARRG